MIEEKHRVVDDILSSEYLTSIIQQINDICVTVDETDPNLERKSEIQQTLKKAMYSYKELLTKREIETKCAKDPDPDWVPELNTNDSK